MEYQLATKDTQKEQSEKSASSSSLQSKPSEPTRTHPVLRLQRAIGNQAVQRLLNTGYEQVDDGEEVHKRMQQNILKPVEKSQQPGAVEADTSTILVLSQNGVPTA